MIASIFAYSRRGCETAKKISGAIPGGECSLYTMEKYLVPGFSPFPKPSADFYGERFASCDALIFVGSCGIAVRQIAPHVKDKRYDPAVICVDERGQFVIPLLSGHIGGANELASMLAETLQATAVITTATDINGKFSVDAWAARNGCVIDDMKAAKDVSAAILERDIPIFTDFPVVTPYPPGTYPGSSGELGIVISVRTGAPFTKSLRLIPRVLHLGIGCRKGTEKSAISEAVEKVFVENGLDIRAVKGAASIDLKAEEAGLLAFCEEKSIPVQFYSAAQLQAVEGDFTPSAFVQSITGVDNVCERAALLGAERLIVKKTAMNGVTVAVAAEKWEVRFG